MKIEGSATGFKGKTVQNSPIIKKMHRSKILTQRYEAEKKNNKGLKASWSKDRFQSILERAALYKK